MTTRKRKHPSAPFATFSLHMDQDGAGILAYEQDGIVEIHRVANCSCSWVTHPDVERIADPSCPVPGHATA